MNVPAAKIYFPEADRKDILDKIDSILESGQLTLGKHTKTFEEKFSQLVNTKHAIAVNSGTSAIEIPMRIFDVKDKEVIVPTNTFFATPAAVLHAGGKIQFADMDPTTFSLNIEEVKERINKNTTGIIVVHIGGIITPQIDELKKLCEDNNLFLFEDAAHAHGSSLDGKMAGSFGKAASFSFYPTKTITSGEGGIIVSDDDEVQKRSLVFRDQGKAGFLGNVHTELGYNWRLSELHAVLGLSQLGRLEEFIEGRNKIARIYDKGLEEIPHISMLKLPKELRCNYYKYIAVLDKGIDRAELKKEMKEEYKVGLSGEVYELPCHKQPIFEKYVNESLPVSEDLCSRHICLPLFPTLTTEQAEHVLSSLDAVLRKK